MPAHKSEPNGKMDDLTINCLRHFQLSGGVSTSKDSGAGFFGPKTQFLNNIISLIRLKIKS